MIGRCFIHVAGPPGSGKTTFVETLLGGAKVGAICVRAIRDDSLAKPRETTGRSGEEIMRYRRAGAWGAAGYRFPPLGRNEYAFFESRFMEEYSEAVVIEGDLPVAGVDLSVFVAPVPTDGGTILRRALVDADPRRAESVDDLARAVESADSFVRFLSRGFPGVADKMDRRLLADLEEQRVKARVFLARLADGKPEPQSPASAVRRETGRRLVERWVLADGYSGIERAGLVVFNLRNGGESVDSTGLIDEVSRLRKDAEVYRDVLGGLGSRKPVTVVVADLTDAADPGTRKAVARVRRAVTGTSSVPRSGAE